MFQLAKSRFFLFLLALGLLFVIGFALNPLLISKAEAAEPEVLLETELFGIPSAVWCSGLASYTDWYNGKRALFVYRGKNNPNPYAVAVRFDGAIVPDAGDGVQTYSGPQFDLRNGWIGYYISKRWAANHSNWNDDWRWSVSGCFR